MFINELLNGIKGDSDLDKLSSIVSSHGWEILGQGQDAVVAEHPNKNYVLKIFLRNSVYRKFVDYSQKNQSNPHVPKFSSLVRDIPSTNYSYVRMEKLSEFSSDTDHFGANICYLTAMLIKLGSYVSEDFPEIISDLIEPEDDDDFSDETNLFSNLEYAVEHNKLNNIWKILGERPDKSWVKIINDLTKLVNGNQLDMNLSNIMSRGNIMIISDPFYQRPD